MKELETLLKFLYKNNFFKEASVLKKISTPLDVEYLEPAERKEVYDNTKDISPKIYVVENIFDEKHYEKILKEIQNIVWKKTLDSGSANLKGTNRIDKLLIERFFRYLKDNLNSIKDKKVYRDSFGTTTIAISKKDLLKAILSTQVSFYLKDVSNGQTYGVFNVDEIKPIANMISDKMKEVIFKYENYDLYFVPAIHSDTFSVFDLSKGFIYHDFFGHGFERLLTKFNALIDQHLSDILEEVFEYVLSVPSVQEKVQILVQILGKDKFNRLLGQEAAAGLQDQTLDFYYDLYSIIFKNNIKISNIDIKGIEFYSNLDGENKMAGNEEQIVLNKLNKNLEVELNDIKDDLIKILNNELESLQEKKYILQYLETGI